MCGCRWTVGLYNKKTNIYQTIKGLIILFIKLQFSIRCNQAFGHCIPQLPTSTSTSISNSASIPMASSLASFLMHSYHSQYTAWLQTYIQQRSLCIQSSQVHPYVLIRPGGYWSIHQEAFIILVNALTFIKDKTNVRTREKS